MNISKELNYFYIVMCDICYMRYMRYNMEDQIY